MTTINAYVFVHLEGKGVAVTIVAVVGGMYSYMQIEGSDLVCSISGLCLCLLHEHVSRVGVTGIGMLSFR